MINTAQKLAIGLQYQNSNKLLQAQEIYQEILQQEPNHAEAWHWLGVVAYQQKEYVSAIEYINKAIKLAVPTAQFLNNLGIAYRANGQYSEAISAYKQALALEPNNIDIQNNLNRAIKNLNQLNKNIDNIDESPQKLAASYLAQGNLTAAMATCQKAIEINPNIPENYKILGNIFLRQNKYEEAKNAYIKALKINPNFAEVHANLGSVNYKQGKLEASIECYQKAITINPQNGGFYWNLSQVLEQVGRSEEAKIATQKALEIQPELANIKSSQSQQISGNITDPALNNAENYKNQGNIFLQQGNIEAALQAYQKAIEIHPNFAEAYGNIGNLYYNQKNYEQAQIYYQKAIEINPNIAGFYWNLGRVLDQKGQGDEAIQLQCKALELDPNLVGAENYYNLGSALLNRNKLDEALRCYQKSAELKPELPEAHHRIGIVLHRQGKIEEGLKKFQDAIDIKPDFIPAYQSLCDFSISRGDYKNARKFVDKYIEIAKDDNSIIAKNTYVKIYQESGLGHIALNKFLELEQEIYQHQNDFNSYELDRLYGNLLFSLPHLRDDLEANIKLTKFISNKFANFLDERIKDYPVYVNKGLGQRSIQNKPLRIGFISKYLRRHSVGWCSADILQELTKITPHIHIYISGEMPTDDRTLIFENLAEKFYRPKSPESSGNVSREIIEEILKDNLDIVVEMDSLTLINQVEIIRAKPAPVCISWLGFDAPFSSGDNYYLCDWHTHPSGREPYYTEKLIRMPDCHVAISGLQSAPTDLNITRKAFRISSDQIVYLCVAPGQKFNIDMAKAQIAILKQVPDSILLYKGRQGDVDVIESVYREVCQNLGVSPHRIKFLPRTRFEEQHRVAYQMADVLLDAYPYNGMTHTLEALWFNLPVVTRTGEQSASRLAYCLLKTLGVEAGVTYSWEEFIERGIRFGLDADFRNSVKEQLIKTKQPETLSPLWNPQKFAQDMYAIFQELLQQQELKSFSI